MPKVVLSLPRLGVKRGGFEKRKEIYVLSFTADLNPPAAPRLPDITAANNETLPNIAPQIQGQALLRFVLLAVSNTFQRIQADQPVSLSGSGILLYPNLDPKGLLANHFVVIEDDVGKRNLGRILANLFANDDVKSLVEVLQDGITQPALGALLSALVSRLPQILKKNKDDFLFAHSHSGFDFDNYGIEDPAGRVANFELENDRIFCTLRVRVN